MKIVFFRRSWNPFKRMRNRMRRGFGFRRRRPHSGVAVKL